MNTSLIMTPGPTQVRENVRLARAKETTNPDLDLGFFEFYKETCERIGYILETKNEVRILSGEGILGLEAACASLTEKNDRVLVIDNGIFGEGFGDFVKMYGGIPVLYSADRKRDISIEDLKKFIAKDNDFKYATIVHCDTPSGVLNDIEGICKVLKENNILTVVDSVSGMVGEDIRVDAWGIDIAVGGSQKCFSAPPGITFMSISDTAFKTMEERKTSIASFYCNLLVWKDYYKDKWFPYTPPISDIIGISAAIDNILQEGLDNIQRRHAQIGEAVRKAIIKAGLKLYIQKGYSNTVTVIKIPEGIEDALLREYMRDKCNVFIAGSFGYLEGEVIRLGHMGENARVDKVAYTLLSLERGLEHFGFKLSVSLVEEFYKRLNSI